MTSRLRLGRMARWQRRSTYIALGLCAGSGLVWFLLLDVFHATPSQARPWWVAHGVSAIVATMSIGAAAVQHVVVTWRAARGRWSGTLNLVLLVAVVGTAAYLMYGAESGHEPVHWIHSIVGLVAIFGFAWHVLWGRTRVPAIYRTQGRARRPRS